MTLTRPGSAGRVAVRRDLEVDDQTEGSGAGWDSRRGRRSSCGSRRWRRGRARRAGRRIGRWSAPGRSCRSLKACWLALMGEAPWPRKMAARGVRRVSRPSFRKQPAQRGGRVRSRQPGRQPAAALAVARLAWFLRLRLVDAHRAAVGVDGHVGRLGLDRPGDIGQVGIDAEDAVAGQVEAGAVGGIGGDARGRRL
jgi:hypothetical protein